MATKEVDLNCLSNAGKLSTEKYLLNLFKEEKMKKGLLRKSFNEKLINIKDEKRRKFEKEILSSEISSSNNSKKEKELEEENDIFNIKDDNKNSGKKGENSFVKSDEKSQIKKIGSELLSDSLSIDNKYKYYHLHKLKILDFHRRGLDEKFKIQQVAGYSPNLNSIYKKIVSGPSWDRCAGRKIIDEYDANKKLIQINKSLSEKKLRKKEENKKENKKIIKIKKQEGFTFGKQTQRDGIFLFYDSRIRYEKKFNPLRKNMKLQKNDFRKNKTFDKVDSLNKTYNNSSYNEFYDSFSKGKSAVNFKSYLSREQLYKLERKDNYESNGNLHPNYKSVEGNIKVMVKYNRKKYNKYLNKKVKGVDSTELIDKEEAFKKTISAKLQAVPNFLKMTSRPDDPKLPAFMKGVYNRLSFLQNTDKSLKMNNFANSGFPSYNSGCFIRKSFNKLIYNKNNNNDYLFNNDMTCDDIVSKLKKFSEFYNFNNEQIDKELNDKKFDKITFKSIKLKPLIVNLNKTISG